MRGRIGGQYGASLALVAVLGLQGCLSQGVGNFFGTNGVDTTTTGSIASQATPVTAPSQSGGMVPQISIDPGITNSKQMYAAVTDNGISLPRFLKEMDQRFVRRIVPNITGEAPGTIVVDTRNRYLYLVQEGNEAIRYGVGVGKEGFALAGSRRDPVQKEWPVWTPPAEMVARKPELQKYANGMEPGAMNPLGARAMYIFKDGRDTLFQIHGSPEWKSIGTQASSGCIRLINQDVIDLYNRVRPGSPIVVL
ncbi:MAG: L,D-transpeptidase [Nitratireductor sp.]